jgi:hypothetical protein
VQFVKLFQVGDCRDLQEIEVVVASITQISDVAMEGVTPTIVLADVAVDQQVVPPSERTRAFNGLRSHGHLPFARERLTGIFVPRRRQVHAVPLLRRKAFARARCGLGDAR